MKEINNFLKVFFIVFFCTIVSAKGAILTIVRPMQSYRKYFLSHVHTVQIFTR